MTRSVGTSLQISDRRLIDFSQLLDIYPMIGIVVASNEETTIQVFHILGNRFSLKMFHRVVGIVTDRMPR